MCFAQTGFCPLRRTRYDKIICTVTPFGRPPCSSMRHRQAVRQGTLTPPSQVRLLLAQLEQTPHGGFRASVRGFCCLDGKSYAREAKLFQGPRFPFCRTGRPAALPRRKKPPSRLCPAPPGGPPNNPAGCPKARCRSLTALGRVPGRPDGPGFPCRPRTTPAGLQ